MDRSRLTLWYRATSITVLATAASVPTQSPTLPMRTVPIRTSWWGGVSEGFTEDITPPTVELFLNDTLFEFGGLTDENPWLLARVYDEGGINASGVGIGHDIKATLDGQSDESVVLNDFYTTDLNTYKSGTVRYPFNDLEAGRHALELVVWDVQNNKGSASTEFLVAASVDAAIGRCWPIPTPRPAGSNSK